MSTPKIIFNLFIISFVLLFIINSTYFDTNKYVESNQNLWNFGTWFQKMNSSWDTITLEKIDENYDFKNNEMYVENLNYIDKIYFSSQKYVKQINGNTTTFMIWSGWIYLFDLYDLTNNYLIYWKWFKIKSYSPWKFFIDNRDFQNIKIFSFDAIFDISLLNNSSEMANASMYPKMFFWFNASRNKFLKNADLFRIENIFKIFYVKENILNDNNKINFKFFTHIYTSNDMKIFNFFNKFFIFYWNQWDLHQYNEWNISLLSSKWLNGFDYINKYFLLFFNDEKKIIYYKKNIINNLNNFFEKKEKVDTENILISLADLKKLNEKEYINFQKIIYYYYTTLLKINSVDYIDKVFLFSEIISKGKDFSQFKLLKSSFFLNKIYSLINNKIYTINYIQWHLLDFFKYYLEENKIKIQDKYKIKIQDEKAITKIEYVMFYIKNIFLYDLNLADVNNHTNIFNILKIYNNVNENINQIKKNQNSETLIIENFFVLDKILYEVRKNFFEEKLNQNGLLVVSTNTIITSANLSILNDIMKSFFDLYKNKKSFLSMKNQIYNDKYNRYMTQYKEYYDALNNYSEYLITYNKASIDLLDTKTVFEFNSEITLSQENLISYLSTFEWLDISNISFDIEDNFYKIHSLWVHWETFSFNLYPIEFYRIENIIKNGEKLNGSYELSSIKYEWDKKFKDAEEWEAKNKVDFRKFFINIFFNTTEVIKEDFILHEDIQEDKVVSIFKRDKLLWERGDFSQLKWFLEYTYQDIKVKLINNIYDIQLENILLRTSILKGEETIPVIWLFRAQYIFNEKDHYFKNISIQFYNEELYNNEEKVFLFEGKSLDINKNINTIDFKNEINSIIQDYFNRN